jgi:Zn-dependent protease with chaperone function
MAVEARYFDGRSARASTVMLTLAGDMLQVSGEGMARTDAIHTLRISEPMGAAPRLISFPDGAHCEVRDHARLAGMLAATRHEDSLVVRLQSRWRWALAAVTVTVAAVFAGYHWALPMASEWVAYQLPEKLLAQLAEGTLKTLDRAMLAPSKLPKTRQDELAQAFARLAAPGPAQRAKAGYTLLFRDGKNIGANALALPDGTIILTDQLVALAAHDEEILAVLTHELGHLERRHSLRMMVQGSIVAFVVSWYIGDVSSVAAGLPTLLLQARYSRDFEREADAYGAAMLKTNGIAPHRLADMLEKLEAEHRDKRGGKKAGDKDSAEDGASRRGAPRGGLSDYLASHPATRERIDALTKSQNNQ